MDTMSSALDKALAAIGLASEIRKLGREDVFDAYNLTGVGVFSGDDARSGSKDSGDDARSDSTDAEEKPEKPVDVHVDENMALREAMQNRREKKRDGGDERRAAEFGATAR